LQGLRARGPPPPDPPVGTCGRGRGPS